MRELEASGEVKEIQHLPIKPAFTNETSSEFYDPVIRFVHHGVPVHQYFFLHLLLASTSSK